MRFAIRCIRWSAAKTPAADLVTVPFAAVPGVVTMIFVYRREGLEALGPNIVIAIVAAAGGAVLLWLCRFSVNLRRAAPTLRGEDSELRFRSQLESGDNSAIFSSLSNEFSKPSHGIAEAAVFGSLVQSYATKDIDVVIRLASAPDKALRKRIRQISDAVEASNYDLPIHITWFEEHQEREMWSFLAKAGVHQPITIKRKATK